jgi:L-fucose isomerase-like protein
MISRDALRIGVLVIGRKRPGFDAEWGRAMEAAAYKALNATGLTIVKASLPSVDDATLRSGVEELREQSADVVVVLQPTMGDGRLAPILGQLWDAPVILWATPERPDVDKVTACSLVGAHAWGATLRQLGRPFEIVYVDPRDDEASTEVTAAAWIAHCGTRFSQCKIGLVGYHAPGFIDMHADPMAISQVFGVEMHHFGVDEFCGIIDGCKKVTPEAELRWLRELGIERPHDVTDADIALQAQYGAAMTELIESNNLDALALRCWPELPNRYGAWPYVAMSRMTEAGDVVALEGDVDGALLGLMGKLANLGPGYLSDWLEHDEQTITLWHPGHAPLSICEPGTATLSRHFNDNKPLVIDAEMRANEPITLARLWRVDNRYMLTALDARTITPRKHFHGCCGLAALDVDARAAFDLLVHEGMPHHLTVFMGQHEATLRRVARVLGVEFLAI